MWKRVKHNCQEGSWTVISERPNLVDHLAEGKRANEYLVWDASLPKNPSEREQIIQAMFRENEDVHSIFLGARVESINGPGGIKDPPILCGDNSYCFCIRDPKTNDGRCMTSYPIVDGSFNILCDGGAHC